MSFDSIIPIYLNVFFSPHFFKHLQFFVCVFIFIYLFIWSLVYVYLFVLFYYPPKLVVYMHHFALGTYHDLAIWQFEWR